MVLQALTRRGHYGTKTWPTHQTPPEARQAEPGPSVLALLMVSTGLAVLTSHRWLILPHGNADRAERAGHPAYRKPSTQATAGPTASPGPSMAMLGVRCARRQTLGRKSNLPCPRSWPVSGGPHLGSDIVGYFGGQLRLLVVSRQDLTVSLRRLDGCVMCRSRIRRREGLPR